MGFPWIFPFPMASGSSKAHSRSSSVSEPEPFRLRFGAAPKFGSDPRSLEKGLHFFVYNWVNLGI